MNGWPLWRRQVVAILRLEARKNFIGRRAIPIYFLALIPMAFLSLRAIILPLLNEPQTYAVPITTMHFAIFYQTLFLRFIVFFGCLGVFSNQFRGEMLDRSVHYYLLAPVRREVLVLGKYLAGLLATVVIFGFSVIACIVLMYLPNGPAALIEYLTSATGFGQLIGYFGVTVLACVGYGGVFMAFGVLTKNPVVAGVAVMGWEWANFLMPALLKRVSVIHYLLSLCPVPISEGPLAIIAEPSSVWLAVPGMLVVTAAILTIACWRVRRMEISYGGE